MGYKGGVTFIWTMSALSMEERLNKGDGESRGSLITPTAGVYVGDNIWIR